MTKGFIGHWDLRFKETTVAGLLYYIPTATRAIKVAELAELGLGYAFDSRLVPREVQRGPDGDRGVVVADCDRLKEHLLGFWPEKQRWLKIPGCPGNAWVGRHLDQPIEPADLVRDQVLPGHWVTLADGRDWLCPVARGAIDSDGELGWCQNLPAAVGFDAEGNWTRQGVVAKYAPLWDVAMRWWDAFAAASPDEDDQPDGEAEKTRVTFEFADVNDAALLALATNYRVGKAEVVLLALFDDRATVEILKALIDWPTISAWLKKRPDR